MRESKLGRLAMVLIAAALVGCLAVAPATSTAAKKKKKAKPKLVTTTASSGNLLLVLPDPEVGATPDDDATPHLVRSPVQLTLPARATITDVNASVRLDHGFDADVELYLASPRGVILLSRDNGGPNDNYGAGATSCLGTPTTFDSNATTGITAGVAPFASTFAPQESLAPLNGLQGSAASVPWTLLALDDERLVSGGTLYCWNLIVQYRTSPKKKKKKK